MSLLDGRSGMLSPRRSRLPSGGRRTVWRAAWDAAPILVGLSIGTYAIVALVTMADRIGWSGFGSAFRNLSFLQVASAFALTCISYAALVGYDVVALRMIDRPVSIGTTAAASFTNYALIHSLGFPLLTGGAARYRIYSAAGLSAAEIAKVVLITITAFWMGLLLLFATAAVSGTVASDVFGPALPKGMLRAVGVALISCLGFFLVLGAITRERVRVARWSFRPVPPAIAVTQLGIAAVDMVGASAALYVLVPFASPSAFPSFLFSYALAMAGALLSHAPGGLGVFEAVILLTFPGLAPEQLLPAMLVYRVIYYLLPLTLALIVLAVQPRVARSRNPRLAEK